MQRCIIEGCTRRKEENRKSGLCSMHRSRKQRGMSMSATPRNEITIRTRFEQKIKIADSGCWLWMAGKFHDGYGNFRMNDSTRAHRVAYELYVGKIPAGLQVLHRCDVRHCVNPDHLFLGTHQDNMTDCKLKGRRPRGEDHPQAKLKEADILHIRELHTTGTKQKDLCIMYSKSDGAMSDIVNRKLWKHI